MVMNYKEIPIPDKDKKKFAKSITIVNALVESLREHGLLPYHCSQSSRAEIPQAQETSPEIDLRQQTYDLLSQVREPTEEEKETLGKKGIIFLPVETKSLSQVVSKDQDYFWSGELDYVNSKTELRDYVPPIPLQVGLNSENPALSGSFNKSKKVQLEMIERGSQELQKEFPDARLVMLPSTVYAQADKAYKERTGEVFFKNIFARALDQTFEVRSAVVGRSHPDNRLAVGEWDAGDGADDIGAAPAVVSIRK